MLLAAWTSVCAAEDERSFFDGKTITYVVATKPGGGYDTYARLIAPYLQKYLPGSQVVVRNVPGAGHIIATNQVYAAPPDGLTLITFNTGLIYAQLLEREGIQFDLRRMSWIGKAAADPRVLVVGVDTPFSSVEGLRSSPEPILLATSGVGSASHNESMLLQAALGFEAKLIPGYGGGEAEMAVLRGEVAGMLGSLSSLRPYVERGQGRYLLRVGGDEALLPSVPDAAGLTSTEKGRALIALMAAQAELGRLTAAPPGVPAPRLAVLRQAYAKALADPELIAQAKRLQLPLTPLAGDEVERRVAAALAQPPDTQAMIREFAQRKKTKR
jgi:tripartite-type tricarboxylate transporter receptor subunit TctC